METESLNQPTNNPIETPAQSQPQSVANSLISSKKFLSLIFVMLMLLLVGAGGSYYLRMKKSNFNQASPSPTQAAAYVSPTPADVSWKRDSAPIKDIILKTGSELEKLRKNYQTADLFYSEGLGVWWISNDNFNIINGNSSGAILQIKCTDDNDLPLKEYPLNDALKSVTPIIDKIFTGNGYKPNLTNSSTSIEDYRFQDYVMAFEKDDIKCTFIGNHDCGKSLSEKYEHQSILVACTNQYDENYQKQIPYLKDLNVKDAIVAVEKSFNGFVYLNVHNRRTGYYLIAKKEGAKWSRIYSGQGSVDCGMVKEYQIPKEILDACWSSAEYKLIPNNF